MKRIASVFDSKKKSEKKKKKKQSKVKTDHQDLIQLNCDQKFREEVEVEEIGEHKLNENLLTSVTSKRKSSQIK